MDYWTGYSDEQLHKSELDLIILSGVDENEFRSYPVYINFTDKDWKVCDQIKKDSIPSRDEILSPDFEKSQDQKDTSEYIWTWEVGDKSKPTLVLIHGFGASAMIFYRILKHLKNDFHVYCIDLLGMGRSSRPDFEGTTYDECVSFFINSIEKWRIALDIGKLTTLAHSFGGFIMSKYALAYPQNVNKIAFASPFAAETANDLAMNGWNHALKRANNLPLVKLCSMIPLDDVFSLPFKSLKMCGRLIGKYIIRKMGEDKFSYLSNEEKQAAAIYGYHISVRKSSSNKGMSIMFPNFMVTKDGIQSDLETHKKNSIQTSFYYGDKDWINSCLNGKLISHQLKESGQKVHIIQNSDHLVPLKNKDTFAQIILEDFSESI